MVFPEPTGVLDRAEVLASLGDGDDRWRTVEISDERLVDLGDGVVQLVYRAAAERSDDGSEYNALVSTTYVRENESWLLASHQQTSVGE
jgi:hypothetical protein